MKKILLIFVSLLITGGSLLWAQSVTVSGVVTENGKPVEFVSVVEKGSTSNGVNTDINGRYTITVPSNATLVFSYVGYETQEQAVGGRTTINVVMVSSAIILTDAIAIGYGTAKKGTFTGATSVVSSTEKMKDLPIASFENALTGAATGVQVGSPNGQPGAQAEIRIRGTGSMNASNAPLYVIDGIPANSGDYSLSGSYGGSMGIMSTINPSDIEAITILKDAAATSIYGSRGANGVILVTTKKGKEGALRVNFKASLGFNDWAMNNRPYLNGADSRTLTLEGAYNQGIYNGLSDAAAQVYALGIADQYKPAGVNTDWEGALFRKGSNRTYEMSVSGGDAKTKFYVSLAYRNELGMARNSDFGGYTGKANVSHKSGKWTVNAEIAMAKQEQNIMYAGTSYTNFYYNTRNWLSPNIPMYNADGTFYEGPQLGGRPNSVKDMGLDISTNEVFKSTNNISVAYEIMEGLSLKQTLSYDYADVTGINVWPVNSNNGKAHEGITQQQNYKDKKFYSSTLLTYDKTIKDDHNLNVLLGWDVDDNRSNYLYAAAKGYASPDLWEMAAGAIKEDADSNHSDDRIVSYFGRVNYSYKNKYYASATYRRDGSSRLGASTRWGDFWSVSASWRAKQEDFLKEVEWMDDLKVRASYGTTGTLPSALYSSLATYAYTIAYNGKPAAAPSRVANPNLGWERCNTLDIGVEARFLDRISFEFDFYNRQTEDLLLSVPISLTTGFSSTLLNYGAMNNRGVEVSVGVDILKGDFSWTSTIIASHNRNEVTKIYNGEEFAGDDGNWIREGYSLYSFRAREWAGVDPGTGDSMWYIKDYEGDTYNVIAKHITKDPNEATRDIIAKADPTITGGWKNSLYWNGFDLDFLFTFSLGGHSWDNGWTTTSDGLYLDNAISTLQLDRWQKPGDVANFPRRMAGGGHGNFTSSRWLHSTDHLRLKTLTLGYTLPKKLLSHVNMQNARVFVAGNNLLTWAAYGDYDPEVAISGQSTWNLPTLRSVTFGVELTF